MEITKKVPYFHVLDITNQMCSDLTGEKFETVKIPVELKDGDSLKKYISVFACKEDEKDELLEEVNKNNGLKKKDFAINKKYCHITTYEENTKKDFISFDPEDDCKIKANFNEEYKVVEDFFKKFISFRNNLIKIHSRVKEDDIYQYYTFTVKARTKKHEEEQLKEKAKKFMSSR